MNQKNIQTVIFFSFAYGDSISTLRVIGPLEQLEITIIDGFAKKIVDEESVKNADIIILAREFPNALDEYEKVISLAHKFDIPVILDIDDLLFELPENHPDKLTYSYAGALLPLFQAVLEVDLVTVSTNSLRNYLLPYNKNIIVLPNFLNDNIWQLHSPSKKKKEKIVLGYMGSHTHQPDLKIITPVLLNLLKKYPKTLEIHFWGMPPAQELVASSQVHWHSTIVEKYSDFVGYFQTQAQSIDIFIAPLVKNPFNLSKSHIKFLEYSTLGVSGVYSDIEPYSKIISHRQTGLLASNAIEWEENLICLIEDSDLRFSLAIGAQEEIKENWLLSRNATNWVKAYQQAFTREKRSDNPLIESWINLIKKISFQTHTFWRYQIQQMKDILTLIEEKDKYLEDAAELLDEKNKQLAELQAQRNRCFFVRIKRAMRNILD